MRMRRFVTVGAIIAAIVMLIPLVPVVVFSIWEPSSDWDHISGNLLPRYILNTLGLCLGVLSFAGFWGAGAAWVMARYEVPGKRIFEWLLILPLSIPAYLSSMAYVGFFDFVGPVQGMLRLILGDQPWIGRIVFSGLSGAIWVLGFALAPYVYIALRPVFSRVLAPSLDAARSLGRKGPGLFLSPGLALARPMLAASLSLVLMETISEYGTPTYLGLDTLTSGIFRAWFQLNDLGSAARISLATLGMVVLVLALETMMRGRRGYGDRGNQAETKPRALRPIGKIGSVVFLSIPVAAGFLIPVYQLISGAGYAIARESVDPDLLIMIGNTLLLCVAGSILILLVGLMLAYGRLINPTVPARIGTKIAVNGYAVPGAVLALGLMQVAGLTDRWLIPNIGILVSGTVIVIIYGYLVRFVSVTYAPLNAAFLYQFRRHHEAAQSLGRGPLYVLARIHIPLLLPLLVRAAVLGSIDMIKELPMTMVLRPFDFPTLGIRAYERATNEQVPEASVPALLMVLLSIGAVVAARKLLIHGEREDLIRG